MHIQATANVQTVVASRRFLLFALLVALLGALVYGLNRDGGFMLDDGHTIVNNTLVQIESLDMDSILYAASSFHAGGSTRPLTMLSFALDHWRLGGLHASGFKATNVVIHALTAVILCFFLRQLLLLAQWPPRKAALYALVVAALWVVHPLQASSVLYVVQRMQTLATLFLVLALWFYLGLRRAELESRAMWPYATGVLVSWALAIAAKEDAAMLPLYLLALELTVLRFRAAAVTREQSLKRIYAAGTLLGAMLFLFWLAPHYWSGEPFGGRDYNSLERLLTQGRVLVTYLGQILVPLPSSMPFNYDHYEVSRSLLQPWTTLPALLLLLGFAGWALNWRHRQPVFAFGVLLYLAGHFLTSNVMGLEMVFEHRNHLPMLGILLAAADLAGMALKRVRIRPLWIGAAVAGLLVLVTTAGGLRAHIWGDPVRLARYNTEAAPESSRAWTTLGGVYFDLAGRKNARGNPYLDLAIAAVEEGAARTGTAANLSNVVIYKTIQGTVAQADWDRLVVSLESGPLLAHEKNILWTTLANLRADIGMDVDQALRVMDTISARVPFQPQEYLRIGSTLYREIRKDAALKYFVQAAEAYPAGSATITQLSKELSNLGHSDWSDEIQRANGAASR